MEHSHIAELIKTLSAEEKDQIRQFATLPFFNNGKMRAHVVPLLELCLNHPWDSPDQPLEKKAVYAALFPSQEVVERKLEKVMVEAHKVVKTYLLTQNYCRKENEFHQHFDFAEIVRARGLSSRYQPLLAKLQKMQAESPCKDEDYYYRQFLLEKAIHDEAAFQNKVKGNLNIPNAMDALEIHFNLSRLTLLNFLLLQQKAANIAVPETLQSALVEGSIPERQLAESPALKVSNEIFYLLQKARPEPSDVRSLFDLLLLHEKNLDHASLRKFYTYLRNLCVLVSNVFFDNEEIRLTLFELYKDNLARGYLHFEGKINPNTYLAVSVAAVRVKQYEWALEFIEKYQHDIIGENKDKDIYRFNRALYLFGVGRFSECMDFIPDTSPFVYYLLQAKRLELKALHELGVERISHKMDAFKMFLSRTSTKLLSAHEKQLNLEFANRLTQISQSAPGDQKRADHIILLLQKNKLASEWRWLLEKAEALKNGNRLGGSQRS